jgi:squalene-hopene/tetraprenyl-beta-curcumene cyclase
MSFLDRFPDLPRVWAREDLAAEASGGVAREVPGPIPDERLLEIDDAALDRVLRETHFALNDLQQPDGHWVFEFEADATIPAEYVMLQHFLGEIDEERERRIGNYLRQVQLENGGWPMFYRGEADLSATVKAYLALKLIGDHPAAAHMTRARNLILERGGAAQCNVFTRIALALFGQVPWRAVPEMPVEIMLLPRWFPFHLSKVSYWSRTVIVPLLILNALRPRARNPKGARVDELFRRHPERERYPMNATGDALGAFFAGLDALLKTTPCSRPPGAASPKAAASARSRRPSSSSPRA